MQNPNTSVSEIMTTDLVTISENTIMTEIDKIFKAEDFHHLPVLNEDQKPIGVISKSDYHQLLHHFTHKKTSNYKQLNRMYFRSLIAKEIMSINPITLNANSSVEEAVDQFIQNKHRSVIITDDNGACVGICTPVDILKWIKRENEVLQ